ncbi:MAG: hypothetical protein HMLKMBBP_00681 [Planctomycetes bacterium]|nr:hypothetical protein [Planctomycetota bacterium]
MQRRARTPDRNAAEPLRLNMTPMIDVVFQLLVFFLVTMKFRTLDERVEATMPKDRGPNRTAVQVPPRPKLTAVLKRGAREHTIVKVRNVTLGDLSRERRDATLAALAAEARGAIALAGDLPRDEGLLCEVDAADDVPTGDVILATDAFTASGAPAISFLGAPEPR